MGGAGVTPTALNRNGANRRIGGSDRLATARLVRNPILLQITSNMMTQRNLIYKLYPYFQLQPQFSCMFLLRRANTETCIVVYPGTSDQTWLAETQRRRMRNTETTTAVAPFQETMIYPGPLRRPPVFAQGSHRMGTPISRCFCARSSSKRWDIPIRRCRCPSSASSTPTHRSIHAIPTSLSSSRLPSGVFWRRGGCRWISPPSASTKASPARRVCT